VQCTFVGNSAESGAAVAGSCLLMTLDRCLVAFNARGAAIRDVYAPQITCCDIYGNVGGDWVGEIAQFLGIDGNISADPLFCDPGAWDYRLGLDSPCAPFSPPNPECDRIGAWPVGCGPTPIRSSTWGRIKTMFR
jgi:hypothetical protein